MCKPSLLWIYLCLVAASLGPTVADETTAEADEEDQKGTRPRGLTAEVLNATTISLSWKHPKIADDDCPVKRYVLRLKQDGARRSRAWKVDGARRALGLHNLKADTLYSIRLVAITCSGKGKPSKWIEIMTSKTRRDAKDSDARSPREEPVGIETRPPGRPTNVRTRTYPDSVILNWQSPTENEVVVRGYMVGYGEGVPDVNWQYVDANQRNVTIRNLKPSTQYIISLRAFNKIGKGPTVYDMIYTRALTGSPLDREAIPKPENLRAKVLSPTNVWLQWRDPSLGRAQQITDNRYYNVHYQVYPDGEKLSVVVKALHVVLYELTPGTEYEFSVRTVKDAFYSDFSDSIRNTTYETGTPGSAPRTVSVTLIEGSTAVKITWRPPKQPNGKIKGYLVLHSSDRVRPIAEWNAMATSETSAIVDGLDPGVTYYFKVQARNSIGYGPLSKTSELTIPRGGERNTYTEMLAINSESAPNVDEDYEEDVDADADADADVQDEGDAGNEIHGPEPNSDLETDPLLASAKPLTSPGLSAVSQNTLTTTGTASPLATPPISATASPARTAQKSVDVQPLTDISVPLESIQPSSHSPITAYDKNNIKAVIHIGKDRPRPDVCVMVLSIISMNTSPIKNISFQAAVPKIMKVKLQPPSVTDLPAYNPILPPTAVTQVILIANPLKEKIRLKFKLTYLLDNNAVSDVGEVDTFAVQ